MIKEESSISIKVGDLVYLLGDELGMFGYGLVLEKNSTAKIGGTFTGSTIGLLMWSLVLGW